MARGEINIPMALDTSGIAREIDNGLVKPLEDAEDALKSLEKVDAGEDLARDLKKAGEATEKLDKELDDTRDGLKRLGFAARQVDDDTKSGFGKASENVEEFKSEAAANFSEVTSSFDGSMDSIADLAQGTLGGLASGISGPLGIALGLAAAGIGAVVNGFVQSEEAAEELRQKARDFAVEAVNAGQSTESWLTGAEQIIARIQELEQLKSTEFRFFWEEDPTQLEEWADALKKLRRPGEEIGDVLDSSTESVKAYREAIVESRRATEDERDALIESIRASGERTEADQARFDALQKEVEGSADLIRLLDQEITVRDEAASSAERQRDAGIDSALARVQAEEDAAEAIASAQQTVEDSVLSAYDSMRGAATEYATTEEGALDIGRWLEYTQQHAEQVAAYRANLEVMKLTPEQWTNLMEMPEETRAQWVAQFVALPEDARAPYSSALNDLGSDGGNQAAVGFEDSFDPDANVKIKVDDRTATADIRALTKPRTVDVKVKTSGKAGARDDLDSLTRERTARLNVQVDYWNAQRQIDRFIDANNGRTITIYGRYIPPRIGRGYM